MNNIHFFYVIWYNKCGGIMLDNICDNSVIIVPNNMKMDVIKDIRNNNKNLNIKILSMMEFIHLCTFTYNEETIYYLMKSLNISYNTAMLYIKNLYYIDNNIKSTKMDNLIHIKSMISDKLIKDDLFINYLKDKELIVYGFDYITKYQRYILSKFNSVKIINKTYNTYNHDVFKFDTLENEVIYVAEAICELIDSGIDINNIFISNISDSYYHIIRKVFGMYNINVNLDSKISIYETNIGKYFINNLSNDIDKVLKDIEVNFDMSNNTNSIIYNKLIDVINNFYFTDNYIEVKDNIVEVIKKTYIISDTFKNAINVIDIIDNNISDDKYVFLMGFNQNSFPITIKDEDYLEDDIKPDFLEKSYEMNVINKEIYYKVICNIKNLYITYKEKYLNEEYYPSILIDEYNMSVIDYKFKYSNFSSGINKILLSKGLDNLIKYNEKSEYLDILFSNYNANYLSYDNRFNGVDKSLLHNYLNNKLTLSYSSMDNYYHCAFKYYLSNILKLDYFEETIQTYIGKMYHYVLSKCFNSDFDFDKTVKYFINNNEYLKSYKNDFFLNNIIHELKFTVDKIKYQTTLMNIDESFFEKQVEIIKKDEIEVNFKGFIDKILKKNNNIIIVDYKTYTLDINLNYLPYGLSMQLPVYLYLTKNINKDYKVIGFYLQQILFGKFNKKRDTSLEKIKYDNLKLKGYSLGNEDELSLFDSTLENSEIIHGMKITSKGFGAYSKVLTDKEMDKIYDITDKKIDECISSIVNGKFTINPKRINNDNIGCKYCKFKDICYLTNKDIIELEDIKSLDFLN